MTKPKPMIKCHFCNRTRKRGMNIEIRKVQMWKRKGTNSKPTILEVPCCKPCYNRRMRRQNISSNRMTIPMKHTNINTIYID